MLTDDDHNYDDGHHLITIAHGLLAAELKIKIRKNTPFQPMEVRKGKPFFIFFWE